MLGTMFQSLWVWMSQVIWGKEEDTELTQKPNQFKEKWENIGAFS